MPQASSSLQFGDHFSLFGWLLCLFLGLDFGMDTWASCLTFSEGLAQSTFLRDTLCKAEWDARYRVSEANFAEWRDVHQGNEEDYFVVASSHQIMCD